MGSATITFKARGVVNGSEYDSEWWVESWTGTPTCDRYNSNTYMEPRFERPNCHIRNHRWWCRGQ